MFTVSCREDEEDTQIIDTETTTIQTDLSGYVQKGPFINGTTITVAELDSLLTPTGKNFTTQVIDNKGTFSLKNIELSSHHVQLQADGFYFDEVKGGKSAAQLTLFALSQVEEVSTINANLLSHLERPRVIYLMQEKGVSFSAAKTQAQQEILTVFGIEKDDMLLSEQLDITVNGDDHAILLAISSILQANNSVAELSELVANIITDLREDGKLDSETNQARVKQQAISLNLPQVRQHLEQRYEELGEAATIPNFEQYIDSDGDGILNKDEDDTPNDFSFETQVDVAVNDTITSNSITISGIKESSTTDALAKGGHILVNRNMVTDTVAQLKNGDQIQLQLFSSSTYADTTTASLTVGTLVKHFAVVTDNYQPDAFSFSSRTDVAVDSLYTSDTITVSGVPYPTPATVTNGTLIKNGEIVTTDTVWVKDGDQLSLQTRSSNEYKTNSTATISINGISASFIITTDDYKPDTFSFRTIQNAQPEQPYSSDTIALKGLLYPTPISVEGGTLFVNGEEIESIERLINEGDQIHVEVLASADYATTSQAFLTIGSATFEFNATTYSNPWKKLADFPGGSTDAPPPLFSIGDKIYTGISTIFPTEKSNNFYEYDIPTDTWTRKADFPYKIWWGEVLSFSIDGNGYVGTYDLRKYDPLQDTWIDVANYPGSYSQDAPYRFALSDKLYVGSGLHPENGSTYTDFWEYDSSTDSWKQVSDFPFQYYKFGHPQTSISIGSKGYILAANMRSTPGSSTVGPVYEYNSSSNTWTEFSSAVSTEEVPFIVSTSATGLVFDNYENYLFQFDFDSKTWNKIRAPEPKPYVYNMTGIEVNGKIYLLKDTYTVFDRENNQELPVPISGKGLWEYTPPPVSR
ncbi:MAG: hypothetical protein AAF992_22965 [Bacteroidota bacterium]